MEVLRVLVVEDEEHIARGLELNFELEGLVARCVSTAREAEQALAEGTYDVIMLDVMLPDANGFDVCQSLRERGDFTPVIMLTARGDAEDRVRGLDAGADDYVVKPFDVTELIARIRSMTRRRRWDENGSGAEDTLQFGEVQVSFRTQEALVGGVRRRLTQLEFDLLRYFSEHEGEVVSRGELLEHVWKLRNYPNTRTVDNFIARLRKHFEANPRAPRHFLSHRGAGYKFVRAPRG